MDDEVCEQVSPTFGDYIVYADESGTHNLAVVEADYPVFVLSLCIFEKRDYVTNVVPALQNFKLKWFGHDMIVLHEREMRKQLAPFKFLENRARRDAFMADLDSIVAHAPMTIIAAVIDKRRLNLRYSDPSNPYELALTFCMERLWSHNRRATQGAGRHPLHFRVSRQSGRSRTGTDLPAHRRRREFQAGENARPLDHLRRQESQFDRSAARGPDGAADRSEDRAA